MSHPIANRLGIFAITGSIVNDAFLFGGDSFFTWAKLLFMIGSALILAAGISTKKISKSEMMVIIYALLLLLTTCLSTGPGITDKSISVAASLVMGVVTFSILTRIKSTPSVIIKSYVTWCIIGVIIGIVQTTSGKLFISDRVFVSTIIEGTYRASGLMSDPNYFALICLLGIAFGQAINSSVLTQLALASGVLMSGSRAGILSLMVLLTIKILASAPPKKRIWLSIVGAGFVIIMIPLLKAHLPDSILMVFNTASYAQGADRNSLQDRMLAISAAFNAFDEHPVFGYGLGNLVLHPLNTHEQVSHNSYIELLAETGVVGFLIYCSICLFFIYSINRAKWRIESKLAKNLAYKAAIMAFTIFSVMSLTLVTYYSRIFFFTISIVSLIVARSSHDR